MHETLQQEMPEVRRDIIVPGEILENTLYEALFAGVHTPELIARYEAEVRLVEKMTKLGPDFYNTWINT